MNERFEELLNLVDINGEDVRLPLLIPAIEQANIRRDLRNIQNTQEWLVTYLSPEELDHRINNRSYINGLIELHGVDLQINPQDSTMAQIEKRIISLYLATPHEDIQKDLLVLLKRKISN